MGRIGVHKGPYLTLDELVPDPILGRRLPSELAWRCHALPLAEDNGRVTVAMADPDDAEAREAVVAFLGPTSCVVKGALSAIDARLAELWGSQRSCPVVMKTCTFPDPLSDQQQEYAQAIGQLLGVPQGSIDRLEEAASSVGEMARVNRSLLIMFGKRCHPLMLRLLSLSGKHRDTHAKQSTGPADSRASLALLVAQRPRWPLRSIMLVLCGEPEDCIAVDWALRLARPARAAVTALAVVPPMPAMYRGLARMEQSVASLLTSDTALGRQMHQVAQRLADSNVQGTLRLRQGAPDDQICREAITLDHDLIVMATRPCRWWWRQLKGDPICSMLDRLDRPVLLTEPATVEP